MAHVPPSTNLRWTRAEEAEGMWFTTVIMNASSLSTHMNNLYIFGTFYCIQRAVVSHNIRSKVARPVGCKLGFGEKNNTSIVIYVDNTIILMQYFAAMISSDICSKKHC